MEMASLWLLVEQVPWSSSNDGVNWILGPAGDDRGRTWMASSTETVSLWRSEVAPA